ncbi:unnamed protein product, partial [Ectocarpus sp. 12 AP-2014]
MSFDQTLLQRIYTHGDITKQHVQFSITTEDKPASCSSQICYRVFSVYPTYPKVSRNMSTMPTSLFNDVGHNQIATYHYKLYLKVTGTRACVFCTTSRYFLRGYRSNPLALIDIRITPTPIILLEITLKQ